METGNFTMSYNAIRTSFINDDKNFSSTLFRNMLQYREIFSNTLADQRPDGAQIGTGTDGYREGFGESQQDVLMYSFLAAYTGRAPGEQKLNMFPTMPSLNWRATFDGLKNIPFFKKRFKNVVVGHGYRSTLSMSSFMNNQLWQPIAPTSEFTNVQDEFGNYVARYLVQNVSIMESFSPLFDIDLSWNNGIITKFEIKRSRNIGINFQNNQLTEMKTQEYVVGAGYTLKKFRLPFIVAGQRLENDLQVRLDIGLRDNRTVIRRILEEIEQITAGQQNLTIKFFADYAVSKSVNVRLFYDRLSNNPFVANQFPTVNTNTGISVRFTLAP
jgi:cell surface protein SprA